MKMKGTVKNFREHVRKMFEDLDRERRAADYGDEDEPAGVSYGDRYKKTEDVDRVRRAKEDYGDSYEENLELEELELEAMSYSSYEDGEDQKKKKSVKESNLYSDADKKGTGKEKKKAKGHVSTPTGFEGSAGRFPGPPAGAAFGENTLPTMASIVEDAEGYDPVTAHDPKKSKKKGVNPRFQTTELDEVAPPGWEKTVKKMKKHKEIDNPWALAWYMKGKGDKPGGSKKK